MSEPKFPDLPEGYFFRVKETALGVYPFVQLRKKWILGSFAVDELWQYHTNFDTVVDEIEYLAGRLLERFNESNRIYKEEYWTGDSE